MSDGRTTAMAIAVGALAVICCAGPQLLAAIGAVGLTVWLAKSASVLVPAALIVFGLGGFWYYRRRMTAQACRDPVAVNKAPNHE